MQAKASPKCKILGILPARLLLDLGKGVSVVVLVGDWQAGDWVGGWGQWVAGWLGASCLKKRGGYAGNHSAKRLGQHSTSKMARFGTPQRPMVTRGWLYTLPTRRTQPPTHPLHPLPPTYPRHPPTTHSIFSVRTSSDATSDTTNMTANGWCPLSVRGAIFCPHIGPKPWKWSHLWSLLSFSRVLWSLPKGTTEGEP